MYTVKTVLEFGDRFADPITGLEFSPDGTCIAGAQGRHFTVWDTHRKALLHTESGESLDSVVSQNWSSDGLNTVFMSGWVVTVRFDANMTHERYHQSSTKLVDLASVDPTGVHKAVAQAGNVSIWSRALGQERWTFRENLTVPVDLVQKSRPVAKSIYWSDSPDLRLTVIYETHGIITWRIGKNAETPVAVNRTELLETVRAQIGFGARKTAFVFRDTCAFRIYDHPACTLADHFPTSQVPGPMTFARQGTMLIGAVNDTLFLWELYRAKGRYPVILSPEGAAGTPITGVAQSSSLRPWPHRPRHSIAVAQGSTVTIWRTTEESDNIHYVACLKAGLVLGLVVFLLRIYL